MDLALGTVAYKRTDRLEDLLESCVRQPVSKVYIFDNGEETDRKHELYNRDFPYEIQVTQSDINKGPNYGRYHIAEQSAEDYLLIVDSDNELIGDIKILVDQLKDREDLGGVSGVLLEYGQVKGPFHDLVECEDVLIRGLHDDKTLGQVAGSQFIQFDFLPQTTVFKRECLDDYAWDPEFRVGKGHLDFYIGHKRTTDWNFGMCPEVLFKHSPGGDDEYNTLRYDWSDKMDRKRYLLDKWGYDQVVWHDYYQLSIVHHRKLVSKYVISRLPIQLQAKIMDLFDFVREASW